MVFQHGADTAQIHHVQIIDPEYGCGLPTFTTDGECINGAINWSHLQFDMSRIVKFFRQWNLVPVKSGFALINCHQQFASALADQKSAFGVNRRRVSATLIHYIIGDAARGIATA